MNSCSIRLSSLENNSKGIPTKRLKKRKRKYRRNLKLKLVHEVSIQLQLVYKKSKNDYTHPVNLWIVLSIDLAWKLLSVRSVNNVFHKVLSLQHVPKPKFKSGPKQFLFCLNKCEKHITWNIQYFLVVFIKSQYFYGSRLKTYRTCGTCIVRK